jgi:hypothetical protein
VTLVDVDGNLVDAVAKVCPVQQNVQRHLADTAPLEFLGL